MLNAKSEVFGRFEGWRVQVSPAQSIATPAIWGEKVVFGGGFGSYEVYAVNAKTGEVEWELRTKDDGPTAATVIDGIAFVNTESCTLEAIDIARGKPLWEKWLGDPLLAQPAAADGRVLMVWPATGKHFLGSFDLQTGIELWKTEVPADVISAPVIVGDRAWVTTFDGSVTCVEVGTGRRLWTRQMHATSAPWVVGDEVYVAQRGPKSRREHSHARTGNPAGHSEQIRQRMPEKGAPRERIASLDAKRGRRSRAFDFKNAAYLSKKHGAERKRAFAKHDEAVGFGQAPSSAKMHFANDLIGESRISRAWRFQGSRPAVSDGVLFETAGDRLEATEIASGRHLWSWGEARAEAGERRLTPPAVANGRVLVGTWDGRLVSFEARTGAERWQVSVGAPVHWQPTMSGGSVFAGLEDGSVVCVRTGDPRDDAWPMWGGGSGHNGSIDRVNGYRSNGEQKKERV
ncbi:MAG: PQQ-binding-like beta-propeller repeat protein [bacterium]|nr:PQQ-binding-like beta-propeller repeat protein [bacterium]